jgi:hypothetical protein
MLTASIIFLLGTLNNPITKHNIPCGGSMLKPQKPHPFPRVKKFIKKIGHK